MLARLIAQCLLGLLLLLPCRGDVAAFAKSDPPVKLVESKTPSVAQVEQRPTSIHEPRPPASENQTNPREVSAPPETAPPPNSSPDKPPNKTPPADDENSRRTPSIFAGVWSSFPADKWQALFNTLLIIIGFLQWQVYRRQADIMAIQARAAANAVDVEQPYLFVTRIDKVEFTYSHDWLDGKRYHKPCTKAYVINLGRTPAVLSMSKIGIIFDYSHPRRLDKFWEHTGFHQDTIIVDRLDEHGIGAHESPHLIDLG